MPDARIQNGRIMIDGRPARIISGAIHYFRVHPGLWEDRLDKAVACKIAAQEGYLPAQIYLSGCYFQGIGVRKNIKAAQKWYTLIAEQGIISVQYKLATSYLHSNDSGIPDIDKCIYWLKRVISNREAIEVIDEQEYRYTVHGRELSSSEIKQEAINLLVSLTCKSIEIEALQHDPPDLRSPEEIESLLNAKINPSALRELGLSYYNQEQFSFSSNDKKLSIILRKLLN